MGYRHTLYGAYRVFRLSAWVLRQALRKGYRREAADAKAQEFARAVIANAGIDVHVEGREQVPQDRPFVYMSNHQSVYDIPILWHSLPAKTLRFVAKTELFKMPLWGRAMRVGEIVEVDRSNRDQAIASLQRAAALIQSGVSVWISPEGHRYDSGELGPLKKGGFHLAKNAGVDIVPVALRGTFEVLPPKVLDVTTGRRVDVFIGEPIATEGRSVDELTDELRRFFATHLGSGPASSR